MRFNPLDFVVMPKKNVLLIGMETEEKEQMYTIEEMKRLQKSVMNFYGTKHAQYQKDIVMHQPT